MDKIDVLKILEFEKKYKVKERNILGLNYWYCRRTKTLNDIIAIANNQQMMVDEEKIKKVRILSNKNHINKKDKNIDILLITDARRIKQENKYESIYTDEIERIVSNKYKCLTLEEPSWTSYVHMKDSHFYNCTTKNIKYVDNYELIAVIKNRLFKILAHRKMKIINEEINNLLLDMREFFGLSFEIIKDNFIDHIIYFLTMKRTYSKIIEKINPKCICFFYRDFPFKTLILMIAKEKNIPTIEMQHGSYVEDEPIEKKGDCKEEWKNIPDYLFSFGKFQTCKDNLVYKDNQIKYIGNLFLEKKTKEKQENSTEFENNIKYILIISQSSMGEYISSFASKLSEILENTNYKIIYKFHPNESGRNYSNLNKDRIIQIKDNSEEIYKYQRISYCQIGISSTAIFEGISFQLPTFILKNPEEFSGIEKTLKKFKQGIYFVNNEEDVKSILKNKLVKPNKSDIEMLWESNSKENFIKEISNIIEGRKEEKLVQK